MTIQTVLVAYLTEKRFKDNILGVYEGGATYSHLFLIDLVAQSQHNSDTQAEQVTKWCMLDYDPQHIHRGTVRSATSRPRRRSAVKTSSIQT